MLISFPVLHCSPTANLDTETSALSFVCSNHLTQFPHYYTELFYSHLAFVPSI